MKKALIILAVLLVLGGGAGYYFYDKEQKRVAAERAERDSIRQARELENARIAAMEKAHRDSLAAYERTHSTAVIRAVVERLVHDEMLSGRNHVGGRNWSERINILREQCDNAKAYYSDKRRADSVFRAFSFRGLMGSDIHIKSDSVMRVYYVSLESAYADVHFDIGEEYPEGQNVTLKLTYEDEKWLIDDFIFEYTDGDRVSESEEMIWFLKEFGGVTDEDEDDKKP